MEKVQDNLLKNVMYSIIFVYALVLILTSLAML
ncbi:hypothetical protein SAMN06265340_10941 [Desulfurobacterium atlanticum]|uniref:Uncharacterized protein n=1 Tax=Desulfurobacterium atlanticum TaxID=240169 RepID=A0A238ZK12_9BACT|nr:hypothetical protein SAMN06265340_10941 [Desulfurobacterium atlanticum]